MLNDETTMQPLVVQPAFTSPQAITPGASPYTHTTALRGAVFVSAATGSVSLLEYGRNGVFITATDEISGAFEMNAGDSIRVTYTGAAPTMYFLAR